MQSEFKESAEDMVSKAKEYTERIKGDYESDISTDMRQKGVFGWSLYLYAFIAFGFLMFESSTALMLLTAWVVVFERNKTVNKMIISTLVVYVGMKIGWSVFISIYNLIYGLIPSEIGVVDFGVIKNLLHGAKGLIANLYDFVYVLVGIKGMLMAKKGNYYKIKIIEDMFE